jgi:origin recognition complex subunit 6
MTAGRALCGAFGVPVVASHVFAGVSSVARSLAESGSAATPSRKRARQSLLEEEGFDEQLLPALIFVITSYVAAQFEDQLSGEEYLKRRDMGFAVVVKHSPFSDLDKEEFIITVEKYLREGRENGWFEMPWFENVEDAARRESEMEADEAEAELEAGEDEGDRVGVRRKRKATNDFEDDSVASARRGGGEMRMYSVDWLSEERTREYGRWKATILAEVD